MAGWLHRPATVPMPAAGCLFVPAAVVWCQVAKGQQLLAKLPAHVHLVIKETPSGSEPAPPKGSSHACLVHGGMSELTPTRGLWDPACVKSTGRRVLLLGLRARDSK
jgi:hypothetical protein